MVCPKGFKKHNVKFTCRDLLAGYLDTNFDILLCSYPPKRQDVSGQVETTCSGSLLNYQGLHTPF